MQSAIDVILDYERRSDAVLVRLLGKQYSLEDAVAYAAAFFVAIAAGAVPPTRQARLPLLALVGLCLSLERSLPSWLPQAAAGSLHQVKSSSHEAIDYSLSQHATSSHQPDLR